jgi:GT2 family glycosyltransferase
MLVKGRKILLMRRANVFKELGGFDEDFCYHGDQDLGLRVHEAGYDVIFDPAICARHL